MSRIGECESGRTWNGFRVEGGKAGQGVKFERIRRITGVPWSARWSVSMTRSGPRSWIE